MSAVSQGPVFEKPKSTKVDVIRLAEGRQEVLYLDQNKSGLACEAAEGFTLWNSRAAVVLRPIPQLWRV